MFQAKKAKYMTFWAAHTYKADVRHSFPLPPHSPYKFPASAKFTTGCSLAAAVFRRFGVGSQIWEPSLKALPNTYTVLEQKMPKFVNLLHAMDTGCKKKPIRYLKRGALFHTKGIKNSSHEQTKAAQKPLPLADTWPVLLQYIGWSSAGRLETLW